MTGQELLLFLYNITLFPIVFFSILFLMFSLLNIALPKTKKKFRKPKKLPFVSVQVPVFNDPIASRCIDACIGLDYPKDRFEIIIVDDSTDKKLAKDLEAYSENNPDFIKYIHRENREGYKPGALMNAQPITKGELIVIFDSDWIPQKEFLRKVVEPFSDPDVAIVQTRQGFSNHDKNLISRFASYLLIIYHSVFMPINNKANAVFFCGTAGAIRKKAMVKVGGWNSKSITEDSDLTVRLLMAGYKTVYLDIATPSEVPYKVEDFVKQQMRWTYGNTRVFIDNAPKILFSKGLSIWQSILISFITLGNMTAPIVILMTLFGFSAWFIGEPQLMQVSDFIGFFSKFLYTSGFLLMGIVAFSRQKMLKEFPYLLLSSFSLSLILAGANTVAFFKALFNFREYWYRTPKSALSEK